MKGRINRQNLRKLPRTPASAAKKWLWDTEIPCFGAYRSENDQVSFVYQYRMPGERAIRSKVLGIGEEITLEQARGLAAEMAFQRRQGIDPILEERRKAAEEKARTDLIMANYAAAYLQRRIDAGKPLNKAQTRVIERDIVGQLGDIRIDRMVVEDVEAFGKTMGDRAPSARRMGLVYLKAILNDAKDRGKISVSPALNVDTPLAGIPGSEERVWPVRIARTAVVANLVLALAFAAFTHLFVRRLTHDRVEIATAAAMPLHDRTEPLRPGEVDPLEGCTDRRGRFTPPRRLMGVDVAGDDGGMLLGPVQPDGAVLISTES